MLPSAASPPHTDSTTPAESSGVASPRSAASEWTETSHEQSWDSVETYFECITTCSLDDGECITRCVEELREQQ